jgi:hypothetical protein
LVLNRVEEGDQVTADVGQEPTEAVAESGGRCIEGAGSVLEFLWLGAWSIGEGAAEEDNLLRTSAFHLSAAPMNIRGHSIVV